MASRKKKEHLKFTLFPFVSILLAVVGVLLFLTMLQAVILRGEEDSKNDETIDENTVVFERIPNMTTHLLEFNSEGVHLVSGQKVVYQSDGLKHLELYRFISANLIQVNRKNVENEVFRREHLLYAVRSGGEEYYFEFLNYMRSAYDNVLRSSVEVASRECLIFPKSSVDDLPLNPFLPIGLVILNQNERLVLR